MRFPLEMAQEIGSFLDKRDLQFCTKRLCTTGVIFVSTPMADVTSSAIVGLHTLIWICRFSKGSPTNQVAKAIYQQIIGRIELFLTRRLHVERVVLCAHDNKTYASNTPIYHQVAKYFHTRLPRLKRNLAFEWHLRTDTIEATLAYPSLHALDLSRSQVSDLSALTICNLLHTLNIYGTQVRDVSALGSCQSLKVLCLSGSKVSDVSVLARCQSLHTLMLSNSQVRDVSALAKCMSLRKLCCSTELCGYHDVIQAIRDR
jgi:hypothetical protein